jgi:CheY-like chemotaxis protein
MSSVTEQASENTPAAAAAPPASLPPGLYDPLRHLVAAAELLDRQRLTPEARACARAILQSGRMVLNVLEDMRQLAALSVEPAAPAPIDLESLVEDVEALWRLQTAPSAGRLLLSRNAPPHVTLRIDGGGAKQLLNTLISRALGAGETGVVEAAVSMAAPDAAGCTELRLTVGQNLPPAWPAAHDTALLLADAIAQRLGGVLTVTANGGAGETVSVRLPAQIAEAIGSDEGEAQRVLPERTHILIVDDNATNRMVAGALCEMFGCTTQTADDGVEAVEAARASRFDLILMDIKMPRMDGIEATRAIRRLPGALGRVPIVALTANCDAEAAKIYLDSGMDAVVEKPIKPDRLLETLQMVLEPEAHDTAVSSAA